MKILVVNDSEKRLVNRMVLLNNHQIIKYYLNCLVIKFHGLKLIDVGTKESSEINGVECYKLLKGIQIIFYFLEQQHLTINDKKMPFDSDIKCMNHLKDASLLEFSKFYVIPSESINFQDIPIEQLPSFNGYEMTSLDVAINILDHHMFNLKLKNQSKHKETNNFEKIFFSDNQIKRL